MNSINRFLNSLNIDSNFFCYVRDVKKGEKVNFILTRYEYGIQKECTNTDANMVTLLHLCGLDYNVDRIPFINLDVKIPTSKLTKFLNVLIYH